MTLAILGHSFEDEIAAAKALNCSVAKIKDCIARNCIHLYGYARGLRPHRSIPITIRGQNYASAEMACEVLGVSPNTISAAKARGTLDNVGIGQGKHGRHMPRMKPVPFEWDGTLYPSIRDASRETGIPLSRFKAVRKMDFAC